MRSIGVFVAESPGTDRDRTPHRAGRYCCVCRYRGKRMRADRRTISHVQPPQVKVITTLFRSKTSLFAFQQLDKRKQHNRLLMRKHFCLLFINHLQKFVFLLLPVGSFRFNETHAHVQHTMDNVFPE